MLSFLDLVAVRAKKLWLGRIQHSNLGSWGVRSRSSAAFPLDYSFCISSLISALKAVILLLWVAMMSPIPEYSFPINRLIVARVSTCDFAMMIFNRRMPECSPPIVNSSFLRLTVFRAALVMDSMRHVNSWSSSWVVRSFAAAISVALILTLSRNMAKFRWTR
jgi:hypothetical protein